jgi:phosphate:Na+ symporter
MLLTFQHPFLSLLAGIIFTAIIQSSSATTGIIVALYLGGVNLPFQTAAYLVLGSNIGTCITAMLASIAASRESKRAALAHVLFNVIGCVIFGTLIMVFPGILTWIQATWKDGARQVAMFHTLFNVSTVVVLVGFIKQLAMLVHKAIPEIESENAATKKLVYLGSSIMQIPAIAVTQAQRELDRMGAMALENLQLALETFFTGDTSKTATVLEVEDTIDYLNHNITTWLVRIRGLKLSDVDMEKLGTMLHTVSDIERIGDHAENIVEYAMFEEKYGTKISQAAMDELRALSDATVETITLALKTFKDRDASLLHVIDKLEQKVDDMAITCVENHIQRLQDEVCDPRGGVMFTDMVTDLERCADHANNIAYSILGNQIWSISRHKLLSADQWNLNANPKR